MQQAIPLGDQAIIIRFEPEDRASALMRGYVEALAQYPEGIITDLVSAFDSLCIHYDPLTLTRCGMTAERWLHSLSTLEFSPRDAASATLHRIPVCYEVDSDLADIAQHLRLQVAEVIEAHLSCTFEVAMIGFAPGFPYLRGLPAGLQLPRRTTPRTRVPAGSVAIAETMCGIYPQALPGGWHLIGRTPLRLFDTANTAPCLLKAGDIVSFQRISLHELEAWPC